MFVRNYLNHLDNSFLWENVFNYWVNYFNGHRIIHITIFSSDILFMFLEICPILTGFLRILAFGFCSECDGKAEGDLG